MAEVLQKKAFGSFAELEHTMGTFVADLALIVAREVILPCRLVIKPFTIDEPTPYYSSILA